jgi:hypothetical protein
LLIWPKLVRWNVLYILQRVQNRFGSGIKNLVWFTTREIVTDFAIHQLLGPLISTILTYFEGLNLNYRSVWRFLKSFTWFSVGICKYKPGYKSHDKYW